MTNIYRNFRSSNDWLVVGSAMTHTAALRAIGEIIEREATEAAKIKPGQPGFVGAWPNAEALGYDRDSFAWSFFRITYLEKIKE